MGTALPVGFKPDPAKVEAAIASAEAELAALRAGHDEKAAEADELWRKVLDIERRLRLFREIKAASP